MNDFHRVIKYENRAKVDLANDVIGLGLASTWRFEEDLEKAAVNEQWYDNVPTWATAHQALIRAWRGSVNGAKLIYIRYGTAVVLVVAEILFDEITVMHLTSINPKD